MFCVSVYLVLNKSVNYGILDNNGLKRTEGKHKKMRYPIGVQTFEEMINRKYVYVDKTDLVYDLAGRHI